KGHSASRGGAGHEWLRRPRPGSRAAPQGATGRQRDGHRPGPGFGTRHAQAGHRHGRGRRHPRERPDAERGRQRDDGAGAGDRDQEARPRRSGAVRTPGVGHRRGSGPSRRGEPPRAAGHFTSSENRRGLGRLAGRRTHRRGWLSAAEDSPARAAGRLERDQRAALPAAQGHHGGRPSADSGVDLGRPGAGRVRSQGSPAAAVRRDTRSTSRAHRSRLAGRSGVGVAVPGVLLIAEVSGEQLAATTAELMGEGARLAKDLGGGPVTVLLAGKNIQGLASSPGQLGAERVLVADSQAPTPPSPQWLLAAAEEAAKQAQPDVILLTHAGGARDLGPSLAYRLNSGIVTDATALRVEGGELVISKPVFGGSAIAEFS